MSKCVREGCERPAKDLLCELCGLEARLGMKESRRSDRAELKEFLRGGEFSGLPLEEDWRGLVYSRAVLQRPYSVFPFDSYTWRCVSKRVSNQPKFEPVEHYDEGLWPIEFRCAHVELKEAVELVLTTLTVREATVIRLRFGIGENTDYLLHEIGKGLRLGAERVRQIEAEALRKLRHPRRSSILLPFIGSSIDIENIQIKQQSAYDYWAIDHQQLWKGAD